MMRAGAPVCIRTVYGRFGPVVTLACIGALISACATPPAIPLPPPEPIVRTVTVNVPVPVPCVVELPTAPAFPDTDTALHGAPDIFEATKLLLAGRIKAHDYIRELRASLTACAGVPK